MKLKVILPLVALLLILAGGAAAYFRYFTPEARARTSADRIMQAASAQDESTFSSFGTPDGATEFYHRSAQRNYRPDGFAQSDATFYFRYKFTDENAPNYARVGVRDDNIVVLATGDGLGTTPHDDKAQAVEEEVASYCLSRDDLAFLDSKRLYAHTFRGATMIFENDSTTEYAGEENGKKLLDRMGDFYARSEDKDYSFFIRGYLSTDIATLEARRQIIQNRTTQLRDELVTRGVAADRIEIGEPISYDVDQTAANNERYVIIDVVNNCNE